MYNSYFFLKRFLLEILPEIKGKSLISIHSQEKDIFHITTGEYLHSDENIILEFSTVPNSPYLLKRKYFKPAGKNLVYFFKDYIPQKIRDVKIARGERDMMLILESGFVVISLKGVRTNLFFFDSDSNLHFSVKKTDGSNSWFENSKGLTFISPNNPDVLPETDSYPDITAVKKALPFLVSDLLREIQLLPGPYTRDGLMNKINRVLNDKIVMVKDGLTGKKVLLPESFKTDCEKIKTFDSTVIALQEFISNLRKHDSEIQIRKRVENRIRKDYQFYLQKKENLENVLASENKAEMYDQFANLIMINRDDISKGAEELTVSNLFDSEKMVKIKLKSDLSVNENVEFYFKKARGERLKFETAAKSLVMVKQKIVDLESKIKLFENMDLNDLRNYEKGLPPDRDKGSGASKEELKARRFLIDGKWEVLVGKDSENNDYLTLKVAKQSDYWFHARGSSGSHTILRFSGKEKPPREIIKKVAQIAAFYSKAKNSKLVPVCFTQKKYVVKRKGMNPGQVSLLREEVVMVPPVIPDNALQENND